MKTLSLIFLSLAISACGASDSDEVRQETAAAEIASGYNQQMQRARDVEIQLEQQKREQVLDAAELHDRGRQDQIGDQQGGHRDYQEPVGLPRRPDPRGRPLSTVGFGGGLPAGLDDGDQEVAEPEQNRTDSGRSG